MTEKRVRRRTVHLVMEGWGMYDDYMERPVMVFEDFESAETCAQLRTKRSEARADDWDDPVSCFVVPVEFLEGERK